MKGVDVEDTYAEAFKTVTSRILITGKNKKWTMEAAEEATGFATSQVMCPAEGGVDYETEDTPDGRPGVIIQISAPEQDALEQQLLARIGQCVLTSATSAAFNVLDSEEKLGVGDKLKFFGDGFEREDELEGRTIYRIPIMSGDFIVEDKFGFDEAVAGGNFFIMGEDLDSALEAAEKAVEAIADVEKTYTPFPGGIVSSGSKVGSLRYDFLNATTNQKYCPTIRDEVEDTKLPENVDTVYEIVVNGLDLDPVKEAMSEGIKSAVEVPGIVKISAGNYEGELGQYLIPLEELVG